MKLPSDTVTGLLVTGSNGRIGGALRAIWAENTTAGLPILWQGRRAEPGVDLVWDIGHNPPTELPKGLIILHLAGITTGSAGDLAENARVTQAVCTSAVASGAHHIFVMSSAAIYPPGPDPLAEDDPPGPVSPYGAAKLAAERVAQDMAGGPGLTLLRLANLAGADALLGNCKPGVPVTLDPVPGQDRGPERSYIGPLVLAQALSDLIALAARGEAPPRILNLAQPGAIAMADLLEARGQPWDFGPPRVGAIARVILSTDRLRRLITVPPATPASLIADLDRMKGWPR